MASLRVGSLNPLIFHVVIRTAMPVVGCACSPIPGSTDPEAEYRVPEYPFGRAGVIRGPGRLGFGPASVGTAPHTSSLFLVVLLSQDASLIRDWAA